MSNSVDLYSILGVPRNADQKEIKRAYRKQALKWHPDKNSSPEASDNFRAIAQSFAVLGDIERRRQYDRSGGIDQGVARDADDVDPHVLFETVFRNYTLDEVVEDEMMEKLKAKLWFNRNISITTHVLAVSNSTVRILCSSRRLSFYPGSGILLGLAGVTGVGQKIFRERHDQMFMSSALSLFGVMMLLFGGKRPVLHIDMERGRMYAGTLKLWEFDKEPGELTLVAATEKGGALSVARSLLCILNWMDAVNAEEQWSQFAATGGVILVSVLPLVEFWDRTTKRLKGPAALSAQLLASGCFYSAAASMIRWLRFKFVDDSNLRPPMFDPTRATKYGPFFPRQCKPTDFLDFSKK